jgi:hypothetical protein
VRVCRQKLTYRVVFPFELKLGAFAADGCPGADVAYSLFAVIVHVGSGLDHGVCRHVGSRHVFALVWSMRDAVGVCFVGLFCRSRIVLACLSVWCRWPSMAGVFHQRRPVCLSCTGRSRSPCLVCLSVCHSLTAPGHYVALIKSAGSRLFIEVSVRHCSRPLRRAHQKRRQLAVF